MKRPIYYLMLLLMVAITLVACKQEETVEPEPEPEVEEPMLPTGFLEGGVRDAETRNALEGVNVEVFQNDESVTSAATDATGGYSVEIEEGAGYDLRLSRSGYLPVQYNGLEVVGDLTTHLETVLHINENNAGVGSISGFLTNALTGEALGQVALSIRADMNSRTGDIIANSTSNDQGEYVFTDLQAGHYTIEAKLDGYTTEYFVVICLGNQEEDNQNHALTPILAANETRIILTWGRTPSDLDSHLTGPDGNGDRFHVYFANTTPDGADANLDVDDVTSYGPETITITESREGMYRYSVHNYSDKFEDPSSTLAASEAHVRVYQGSELIGDYHVKNAPGTLWTVFEMEDGVITPINEMSYEADEDNVRSNRYDAPLMVRLPIK